MGSPVIMYQPLWDYTTSTFLFNFSVPSETFRILSDRNLTGCLHRGLKYSAIAEKKQKKQGKRLSRHADTNTDMGRLNEREKKN